MKSLCVALLMFAIGAATMFAALTVVDSTKSKRERRNNLVPIGRESGQGFIVEETWFNQNPGNIEFELEGVWSYDARSDRWQRVIKASMPTVTVIKPRTGTDKTKMEARKIFDLPEEDGLYYVAWRQNGKPACAIITQPMPVCTSESIQPQPQPGRVVAWLPYGRAILVPDPEMNCK